MILVTSLQDEVRMVMCAKNSLCAPEAGFTCVHEKVVCAQKEDRIGM
jgi:hypothetical protein